MIWKEKRNKKLKIVLISVITLIGLLSPFLECFGVFYAEEFPSQIGLAGGYFVKCDTSFGNDIVVLIPDNQINSFTFSGSGQLINTTGSTITTRLWKGSTVYYARWQAYSGLEYRTNDNYATWNSITINNIDDMNIFPKSSDPEYANQNLHLDYNTRHLVIVLVIATMLLIVFRGVKRD